MRKTCQSYLLLTALYIFAGCTQETETPFPEVLPDNNQYPISWSVPSVQSVVARALVDDTLLQGACTPKSDGTHRSIGVWGQSIVTIGTQSSTYEDFVATPLTYADKEEDSNPYSKWNYPGGAKYWRTHAVYNFRACYPQNVMTGLMTQMDATVFQGGPINTSVLQEDVLVAATRIDTKTSDLTKPVPLQLQHIFAALKFKVNAVDGFVPAAGEGITSCWLQNQTNAADLFSPSGYLVHSGNLVSEIKWYPYESSVAPMYLWEHTRVSFNEENTLYIPNGGLKGSEYTSNDGWLLIVPQQVKAETLHFCYTLKNAGTKVFSVPIPAITYENAKQYTYLLEIRGSSAELTLSIAPWNNIESSYDIVL